MFYYNHPPHPPPAPFSSPDPYASDAREFSPDVHQHAQTPMFEPTSPADEDAYEVGGSQLTPEGLHELGGFMNAEHSPNGSLRRPDEAADQFAGASSQPAYVRGDRTLSSLLAPTSERVSEPLGLGFVHPATTTAQTGSPPLPSYQSSPLSRQYLANGHEPIRNVAMGYGAPYCPPDFGRAGVANEQPPGGPTASLGRFNASSLSPAGWADCLSFDASHSHQWDGTYDTWPTPSSQVDLGMGGGSLHPAQTMNDGNVGLASRDLSGSETIHGNFTALHAGAAGPKVNSMSPPRRVMASASPTAATRAESTPANSPTETLSHAPELEAKCSKRTCSATFRGKWRNGNRTRHERQHEGTKYQCSRCSKTFNRNDAKKKHERTQHV